MPAQQSEAMRTRIRETLNDAARSGAVVGALFTAVDKDGAILMNEAAGLRALGRPEPMDDDTYFPLYPVTKIVTSIAPELRPGTLKLLTDAGTLVDIPRAPTLRMLLAHVSDFAYSTGNPKLPAFLDARNGTERTNEFSGEIRPVFGSPQGLEHLGRTGRSHRASGTFGTARSFLLILATLLNGGVVPNTGARILPDADVREMFLDQGDVVPAWRDGIRAMNIDVRAIPTARGPVQTHNEPPEARASDRAYPSVRNIPFAASSRSLSVDLPTGRETHSELLVQGHRFV
ncbi:hypothetical protein AURDEDRAFT_128856 [Auricularia subglabra TFB-10046 SS5]|nr:hypothetical protein AURDEDRAFT_128856 [Auricularia subglabra TFB-10046 SS5]